MADLDFEETGLQDLQIDTSTRGHGVSSFRAPENMVPVPNLVTFSERNKWLTKKYVGGGFAILLVLLFTIIIILTSGVLKKKGSENSVNKTESKTIENSTVAKPNILAEMFQSMNTSINPCDNFYEYACHGWLKNNKRPQYQPQWDNFLKMETAANDIILDILQKSANLNDNSAIGKASRFYQKCLETDNPKLNERESIKFDNQTLEFIWDLLEEHGGWPILYKSNDWNSKNFNLAKSLAGLHRKLGKPFLFEIVSVQDPSGDVTANTLVIRVPDADLELKKRVMPEQIGEVPYRSLVVNIAKELIRAEGKFNFDEDYLAQSAEEMFELKIEILALRNSEEYLEKHELGLNPNLNTTLKELQNMLDEHVQSENILDLYEILHELYDNTNISIKDDQPIVVINLDYLLQVSEVLTKKNTEIIANYVNFQMIIELVEMSTSNLRKIWNDFKNEFYGSEGVEPRQLFCLDLMKTKFKTAVAAKYVEKRGFKDNEPITKMFTNLQTSFASLVNVSTFDPEYKQSILNVLHSTKLCLGYPSWITKKEFIESEYKTLNITKTSLLEQFIEVNYWSTEKSLSTLRKPYNKTFEDDCHWNTFPGETSVHIRLGSPHMIFLPLGALYKPLFDPKYPTAVNYGRLGTIIGHELAHGLPIEDENATHSYNTCLGKNYREVVFENLTLNENLTYIENTADNVGLHGAFDAYQKLKRLEKSKENLFGQFSEDQLFFLGFAQNWCSYLTPTELQRSINDSEHPPHMFRVLGSLRNSNAFANAFNCSSKSVINSVTTNKPKCSLFE